MKAWGEGKMHKGYVNDFTYLLGKGKENKKWGHQLLASRPS